MSLGHTHKSWKERVFMVRKTHPTCFPNGAWDRGDLVLTGFLPKTEN